MINAAINVSFRRTPRLLAADACFVATAWLALVIPATRGVGDEAADSDTVALVTIGEAKTVPLIDAGAPVCVRGIVTFRIGEGFSIQDETAGVWIEVSQARRQDLLRSNISAIARLRPGDEVEVVGKANRGGYAPNILPVTINPLGKRPLPEPHAYDRDRFFNGRDDCLRVAVEGIVQGYRDDADNRIWELLVEDCARQFWVGIDKAAFIGDPKTCVDSRVRCVGVASARFNTRSELISPRLNVCQPEDFDVLEPGEPEPFEAPEVPLAAIARYPVTSRRVRTQGTVTYASPGNFLMLQAGSIGVRVDASATDRFVPGDIAEVSGFVSAAPPVARIVEAVVRKAGVVSPPAPVAIEPAMISLINLAAASRFEAAKPGDYYGCLVTFPATVVGVHTTRVGGEILLRTEDMGLSAVADTLIFASLRHLPPGAAIRVTGIVQPEMVTSDDTTTAPQSMKDGRMQILLRSAADIQVVRWPSWWTSRRLAALLGVVATCAVASLLWGLLLRRQVSRQLATIERKLQGEAAIEERHRIAREFHDTLEQDLAGIELQLDAEAETTEDDRSRVVLEKQRGLLARLRQETHDFLWDLRDPARLDGALGESLAAQTSYLQSGTSIPIALHVDDTVGRVPADVQFHLLRIVREAVHNAVRHGEPAAIEVRVRMDAEEMAVEVLDDGHGFDVAAQGGRAGHFGLRGLTERAERIGASLAITSRPGFGTLVRVTVPVSGGQAERSTQPAFFREHA